MRTILVVTLTLLAVLPGCRYFPKRETRAPEQAQASEAAPVTSSAPSPQTQQLIEQDPFLRSQVDVEFSAKWAAPGVLSVTLMNKTKKTLRVGPDNFRVGFPPNRALIAPQPASVKSFPIVALAAGEQASGELRFPEAPVGKEARLYFNHPDAQPAMARIK